MTVTSWRIVKAKYASTAYSGEGARRYGGRWNSPGKATVYTAGSAALAVLELLVHLSSHRILGAYRLCPCTFDDSLVESVDRGELPSNWRSDPAPWEPKRIGDAWISGQSSVVLRVPSAVVEYEHNFLLNPAHPDFGKVEFGSPQPFQFDPRLLD